SRERRRRGSLPLAKSLLLTLLKSVRIKKTGRFFPGWHEIPARSSHGILQEVQSLLQKYRSELVRQSRATSLIRAHQPGSEPIDIPETIPNPVAVPKPTPTPTEPAPKEPARIPGEGSLKRRLNGR